MPHNLKKAPSSWVLTHFPWWVQCFCSVKRAQLLGGSSPRESVLNGFGDTVVRETLSVTFYPPGRVKKERAVQIINPPPGFAGNFGKGNFFGSIWSLLIM